MTDAEELKKLREAAEYFERIRNRVLVPKDAPCHFVLEHVSSMASACQEHRSFFQRVENIVFGEIKPYRLQYEMIEQLNAILDNRTERLKEVISLQQQIASLKGDYEAVRNQRDSYASRLETALENRDAKLEAIKKALES